MTFQVRDGARIYNVHTEVGEGLTRVVFEEEGEQPRSDMEASDEQESGS